MQRQNLEDFRCPISQQIMLDPVIDGEGETYEREEIMSWFKECKEKSNPPTSPHTHARLDDEGLISNKKIKNQIVARLEDDPSLWSEVYLSKKLQEEFKQAFAEENKKQLAELIEKEPRFASFEELALLKWIAEEQDLVFLKEVMIPNLFKRGQKDKLQAATLVLAEAKWQEGLSCLIEAQRWKEEDYFTCMKEWITSQKIEGVKMLLHVMQQQKFALDKADGDGNTLLHHAAAIGNAELVMRLLTLGLDSQAKNIAGLSAEEIAMQQGHNNVIKTLKDFSSENNARNPHLQVLQMEVQELKLQLSELKAENKKQKKKIKKTNRYLKGFAYMGFQFFVADKAMPNFEVAITCSAHTSHVFSLTVLPDGRIVSGSADNTIKIWEPDSGKCLKTLSGHTSAVYSVAILPDGRLVSGSKDNTIKIWEPDSGKCLQTLSGHTSVVYSLAILPDGRRLVSGSEDSTIKIWELNSGKCLQTLSGHTSYLPSLAILPDGRIVSGSGDHTIKIWEPDSGRCLLTLNEHTSNLASVIILPDGRLVSGACDNTIKIWEPDSGRCLKTLNGHAHAVATVAILPDGRIVSGSNDKTIKIWELNSGKCLQTLSGHTCPVTSLAILPDGRLVSGSYDNTIKIWASKHYLVREQIKQSEKIIGEEIPECKMM